MAAGRVPAGARSSRSSWTGAINVGVLGTGSAADPHRSLPAELSVPEPAVGSAPYESKWDATHPSYAEIAPVCPAEASPEITARLTEITLACARIFGPPATHGSTSG